MKYRIDDCTIGGIINPTLTLLGWVDNSVDKIVIEASNKVVNETKIKKIRSKVTTFHYQIPLIKGYNQYQLYFVNDKEKKLIRNISTNKMQRVIHKYKSEYLLKSSKINYSENRKIMERIREYYKNTVDYKNSKEYEFWLKKHEHFEPVKNYHYQPKISIVMPVYNVPGKYLGYCIDSILNQTYQNFEICIADDCSNNLDTIDTLKKYMKKDERIKVVFRETNGHISRATNSALELATGEFIGLMDNDDKLEKHALNEVVNVLNIDSNIDFIYTDEDKIDMDGNRSDPHFKSDFAIDSLYGGNYICHFSVIRKKLIDKIGGFRIGYEGAQDFDLFLRLTEVTSNIYHIPKVLYHWRMIPGSTAVGGDGAKNYAADAGKRALEDYFSKKKIKVNVDNFISTNYFIEYLFDKEPKVEIIIYNYEGQENTIDSIKEMTIYQNYHITFINKDETTDNINNIIHLLDADYLIFMDANSKIRTVDWIELFVGYASQDHIGVVGGKIVNNNLLVQESGYHVSNDMKKIYTNGPIHYKDYGYNCRLLIPYDYLMIECNTFAIKKEKFIDLNESYNLVTAFFDMQLKLQKQGLSNVLVPQIEIASYNNINVGKLNDLEIMLKTHRDVIDKTNYYNINFSLEKSYCIEK